MDKTVKKITLKEKNYPRLLKETVGAPETLYYLGELPEDREIMISIVGTRKATTEGKLLAKQVARELGEKGIIVVSGLALGIDAAAHEGALKGKGKTIAVLGNGLKNIYPRQNENLANKIIESHGAIISEYPPEQGVLPHQFLERNRIVSGLSLATIVIEAPEKSGSLVTAKNASEEGREVFVFPGPSDHPNYRGSHKLIRDGARLVTSVEDILEDLVSTTQDFKLPVLKTEPKPKNISSEEQLNILYVFEEKGRLLTVDNISEITKLEPQVVNQKLAFLILQGLVEEKNGKFILKR